MSASPARHAEPSMVLSLDDEPWQPSQRLLRLAAGLPATILEISHPILSNRQGSGPRWYTQCPGEHYHLLTAICRLLNPTILWEFGTGGGMSTLALLEGLGPDATIYTVDTDGWNSQEGSWLIDEDFNSGRVTQVVSDMKDADLFSDHAESISNADLIFVDGPKDGITEAAFLNLLQKVSFPRDPVIVFDDIRLMNMVYIWRGIPRPKMDMTSFGHWSGTGLVDWSPSYASSDTVIPMAESQ